LSKNHEHTPKNNYSNSGLIFAELTAFPDDLGGRMLRTDPLEGHLTRREPAQTLIHDPRPQTIMYRLFAKQIDRPAVFVHSLKSFHIEHLALDPL
jgi:hypothetical protein